MVSKVILTNLKQLSAAIKTKRLNRNWSQSDLAKKTGLSQVTISKIERGGEFTVSNLLTIIASLGLKLDVKDAHLGLEPDATLKGVASAGFRSNEILTKNILNQKTIKKIKVLK